MKKVSCPECAHEFYAHLHEVEQPFEIRVRKRLRSIMDWYEWAELHKGYRHSDSELGDVVLADIDVGYDFEYGDNPIFMVFWLTGPDEHYLLRGSADSYGSQVWMTPLKYVKPLEKEVKQWTRL